MTLAKRRRATQACDFCHRRSIRCEPVDATGFCKSCRHFAQPCTFTRVPRRRGVQPRPGSTRPSRSMTNRVQVPHPNETPPNAIFGQSGFGTQSHQSDKNLVQGATTAAASQIPSPPRWQAPNVASQANILDLCTLYFEIVYPIFPFFHQPKFLDAIAHAYYQTNRPLFAVTMAVCALVSSRIRDGCVTNPLWDLNRLRNPLPNAYSDEARRQLHEMDFDTQCTLDEMRAHAILAINAIQNGNSRDMNKHIAQYQTLVSTNKLHDEENWPKDIGNIEKEERRRLFWSTYTLDVFTSVAWDRILSSREQQCNVSYPRELDDEFIQDSPGYGCVVPAERMECWLRGWNFITDLYRIMEHAVLKFRYHSNKLRRRTFLHEMFEDISSSVSEKSVQDRVSQMYNSLPPCFKETPAFSFDAKRDRFGFQAANITATVQLLRMVLFTAAGASIEDRCSVVGQVVDAFVSIPTTYLLAIGSPLLHHLGGISDVLGSVYNENLTTEDYTQVHEVTMSMEQLLDKLRRTSRNTSSTATEVGGGNMNTAAAIAVASSTK